MSRPIRSVAFGLLWLALGSVASATSLTIKDQSFNVAGGGQFEAYFGTQQTVNPSIFDVFCIDYRNTISPSQTYDANVSMLSNVSATRYGTTADGTFTVQLPAGTTSTGLSVDGAVNRYLLAGYLTTQFDLSSGAGSGAKDIGIQDAIWNLLAVDNGAPNTNSSQTTTWINNALSWESGQSSSALTAFSNEVRIYTSSDVAGAATPTRYTTGTQEMIGVVPEPAALALFGTGLVAMGLLVRRRRRAR